MSTRQLRTAAAVLGVLAGLVAIGTAVYLKSAHPHNLGHSWVMPWGWLNSTKAFTTIGLLGGMGVLMVVGGLLELRYTVLGGLVVLFPAVGGLLYAYSQEWFRMEQLKLWAAPVLLGWAAGILAGYVLAREVEPYDAVVSENEPVVTLPESSAS